MNGNKMDFDGLPCDRYCVLPQATVMRSNSEPYAENDPPPYQAQGNFPYPQGRAFYGGQNWGHFQNVRRESPEVLNQNEIVYKRDDIVWTSRNRQLSQSPIHTPTTSFETPMVVTRQFKQESDLSPRKLCDNDMSLWAKTQQLSTEKLKQVQNAYSCAQFPMEIRHYFAQWIEEQPWKDIDENNTAHEQYATQLLDQLLQMLNSKSQQESDFITKLRLQTFAKQLRDQYGKYPMTLVQRVKACLATEEALISMVDSLATTGAMDNQDQSEQYLELEIQSQMELIGNQIEQTDQELRKNQMMQEKFVIDYQNQLKITNSMQQLKQHAPSPQVTEAENQLKAEKEEMDKTLLSAAQQLLQQRIELARMHKDTLTNLANLQKKVVDEELISWKRRQQLAGNGAPFDHSKLDTLQKWCECLADLGWKNRQQIIKVDLLRQQLPIDIPQGVTDIQPELNKIVTGLVSSLVTSTFIVEQQPPQVLKKDARFAATVRLLVGGKLNLQMTPPRVKATIISEQQARSLLQTEERRNQKSGDILNNEGPMDYHQHTGQLSITFRNMKLNKVSRTEKRGSETVAEEKFCILFSSDFNVGGNELKFHVWTLSLPVVVTVHGNQECQATATFLWDNQFSDASRIPFQVPDTVPWPDLAVMLSTKFQQMTGRGLSEPNLKYLAHKIFGGNPNQDYSQAMVTWTQFNKENLPGRNFTFWDWFWSVGKLVKEHLRHPWNDGSIVGFMDKTESQDILMTQPNGTFLLRFSDGTSGGITIAWVADQQDKPGERQVWNLAPFTIKDFSIRGLADRVKDLVALSTLYPDIPKDAAFSKYYSPVSEPMQGMTQGGYVKTTLINVIDPPNAGVLNIDNPQTPQPYTGPSSPAQSFTTQPMTPTVSAMDAIMENEENSGMPMSATDFTQEDLDFNKLNEWLAQQSSFK